MFCRHGFVFFYENFDNFFRMPDLHGPKYEGASHQRIRESKNLLFFGLMHFRPKDSASNRCTDLSKLA